MGQLADSICEYCGRCYPKGDQCRNTRDMEEMQEIDTDCYAALTRAGGGERSVRPLRPVTTEGK